MITRTPLLTGVVAGLVSIMLSVVGLIYSGFPILGLVPSCVAAVLVYRALSTSEGLLARFIAVMAIVAVIPALVLNGFVLYAGIGW